MERGMCWSVVQCLLQRYAKSKVETRLKAGWKPLIVCHNDYILKF